MNALRLRAALAVLSLLALGAEAQPREPVTIGVDVNVVSVTVVAYDKGGHFVQGLTPKDVRLLEDGVPQEISFFREAGKGAEKIPLSVVLVLDASGSMHKNLPFLQEAANAFIRKMEDVDSAMVISFNDTIKVSAEFSRDTDRLEEFVDALQAWGGTSLYDALGVGLRRIKDQAGRKAVIVFSDGDDTTSASGEREVVDYARAVEATIYSVGIRGDGPGGTPKGFLKRVAEETGGQAFFPGRIGDLIQTFRAIAEELHNHYALAYSPKRDPDGSWRAISVSLPERKDVSLRVRKGYFAVPPRKVR